MVEDITTLIISYLNGDCTEQEENWITQWLKEKNENKRIFDEISDIWYAAKSADKTPEYDAISALKTVKSRINRTDEKKIKANRNQKIILYRMLRVAAVFVLAFISGVSSMLLLNKSKHEDELTAITAPIGSKTAMSLPDGTRIWLNAGSTLKYTGQYNKQTRIVNLEGEAYFDVAKNSKLPFIVDAANIRIKAIGTAFNVKAYPEEKRVETTLVKGLVEIERTGFKNPILLKPNQKIVFFNADNYTKTNQKYTLNHKENLQLDEMSGKDVQLDKEIDTEKETCWKDGKLIFDREPLVDLVITLERKYDVRFTFASEKLKSYRYTGTFNDVSLEQIMDAMRLSSPVNYIIKDKQVELREKRNNPY